MRFGAYIMLLFSINLIFYAMGYHSYGIAQVFSAQGSNWLTMDGIITGLTNAILNPSPAILTVMAGITIAAIASLLLGFSAIYIIPLVMLFALLNYFAFPLSIIDAHDPMLGTFGMVIVVFLNLLSLLAITSFVRGGGV